MSKPLRAGGEVDSWCTKCKLVLNHRIIAMEGDASRPARVECMTCRSHHNFRPRPPGEKAPKASAGGAGARSTSASASSTPRSTRPPTRMQQAAMDRERTWERAIAGKGVHDFRPYRVSETFSEGELVHHKKFGDGVVTRILDSRKIEILFKDEPRTLAQGLTD